jgi:dihydroneopterin aldolase
MEGQSSVGIDRLQLPHGVFFKDVWSNVKEQPAYLNINVALSPGFGTAARLDEVNDTTLHYGNLAKNIRGTYIQPLDHHTVLKMAQSIAYSLSRQAAGGFAASHVTTELHLPKASMTGGEISYTWMTRYDPPSRQVLPVTRAFSIVDMTVMALIGVNAYEKQARQPIIANLTVDCAAVYDLEGVFIPDDAASRIDKVLQTVGLPLPQHAIMLTGAILLVHIRALLRDPRGAGNKYSDLPPSRL